MSGAAGIHISPYGGMLLAALRGRDTEASVLLDATVGGARKSGEGLGIQYARWARAILCNGLGRYDDALSRKGLTQALRSERDLIPA